MKPSFDLSLYFVTDHRLPFERLLSVVEAAVAGGVTLVQYRNPDLAARALFEEAAALKALLDRLSVPLLVNDRVDVARAVGAAGAHVGQSDLPTRAVRDILGPSAIIGLSITEADQVEAVGPEVDYLGVGPVFATLTKGNAAPPLGLSGLATVATGTALPTVAIGGIDATNAAAVAATGAGLAVVSALSMAPDPELAARTLRRAYDHA